MSAKKYLPIHHLLHYGNRVMQADAVALGVAGKGRTESLFLAEGQVAAQDCVSMPAEGLRESNQQRSRAVAARSMRQNQGVSRRSVRLVKPATDKGFERMVLK